MEKKANQLGMNASTASGRLLKDLLHKFAVDAGHKCYRCGGDLSRNGFSIEHKTPWLDSDDPIGLFFDLSNIAFSHQACNAGAARRPNKRHATKNEGKMAWQRQNRIYCPERRRGQYLRTGN